MEEWRAIARRGHALGNRTLFHPWLKEADGRVTEEIKAMNTLLQAVDAQQARTLAYTCGDETIRGGSSVDVVRPFVPDAT